MSLYLSTVRHLTAEQVWYRGVGTARRRWRRLTGQRSPQPREVSLSPAVPLFQGLLDRRAFADCRSEIDAMIERAESISQSRFRFLNQTVFFDDEIDWHYSGVNQLWRYHLHYFDYVLDLLT